MTTIKPFSRQGNFTAVDNAVIDEIMPNLTTAEWMILSLIIRKTVGWHKDIDGISYSQFIEHTSIKSNTTIKRAIDGLVEKRMVELGKGTNFNEPHYYRLNKDYTIRVTESVERPVTFSVERPVTESVDTKESYKQKENKAPALAAYEQTFGPMSSQIQAQKLADDIEEFGETAVTEAIKAAAAAGARSYGWSAARLRNRKGDAVKQSAAAAIWEGEVQPYMSHTKRWAELTPAAQAVIRKVGGQSRLREVREGFELDQLKREVMSYV